MVKYGWVYMLSLNIKFHYLSWMGGGGWGKSKLRLNPAWAELGNIVIYVLMVACFPKNP